MTRPKRGTFEYLEAKIRRDAKGNAYYKDFEWLCKWYLENSPLYRGKFKTVWPFRQWPYCWGPDCGVDVIAEAHDGKIWAVQAKAFLAGNTVPKSNVDSFLSESSRLEINHRLLIATTDKLSTNAKRVIKAQEKPVSLVLRETILSEAIVWPTKIGGKTPRQKRRNPKRHQKDAVNHTLQGFRRHKRGRLIMACGTGKTLTALWINEKLKSRRTLLLVPSISLAQQTLREWGQNTQKDFDCLVVCSDESVGSDRDDPAIRNVAEMGIDPTTKPREIAAFLTRRRKRPAVVIATYHSSERVSAGQKIAKRTFDLAICDEAHRLVGGVTKFTTILDNIKIRCHRRLFMTATPLYFSTKARRRAAQQDLQVFSMDDVQTFGPEFHRLNFHHAIAARPKPLLTDYRVVIFGVTQSNAEKLVSQGSFVHTEDGVQTDARTLASQIGLAKAMRDYDLRRVITFHGSIDRAKRFVHASFPNSLPNMVNRLPVSARPSGQLSTNHISSRMPASSRATVLKWLATLPNKSRGVISNCACLREGVDVPEIDGIAFIDPKRSTVDIIQAVGRAIRLSAGKTIGTVVIPVFIREGQSAEEILESSAFKTVWDVLKALRSHDQRLAEHLDQMRLGIDQRDAAAPPKLPPNVTINIPRLLIKDFEKAFCTRLVVNTTQRPFESWITLCREWCAATGKPLAEMISSDVFKNVLLGRWVTQQRSLNRQSRLFPHQVEALNTLGMVWVKQLHSHESWARWIDLCDRWCEAKGSLGSVTRTTVFCKKKLGRWLEKKRAQFIAGDLPESRTQQLIERGMVWKPHDESFERGLAACVAWLAKGNTLMNCGRKTVVNGFPFAKWISVQRDLYRHGQLEPARIKLLEDHGMVWDPMVVKQQQWHTTLQDYSADHGSLANVKQNEIYKGRQIGAYLNHRRRFLKRGSLPKAEVKFLDSLGMVWEPRLEERAKILRFLKQWKRTHGSFDDLQNKTVVDGFSLGAALARWQARRRAKALEPVIDAELTELGIEPHKRQHWDQHRERILALLGKLKKKHGTLPNMAPDTVFQGYRVGAVLQRWRFRWRNGSLDAMLIQRLKKLGVDPASRQGRRRSVKRN